MTTPVLPALSPPLPHSNTCLNPSTKNAALHTLVIRPSGPVPLTCPKGTPFSSAILRANGLAKNLGLAPSEGLLGAFCSEVPALLEPYLPSSAGVPSAGVPPDLLASFWSDVDGVDDLFSPLDLSTSAGFSEDSAEEEEPEPSAARASAPERSSPSSPMMAMGVPTLMALAPSCDYRVSALEPLPNLLLDTTGTVLRSAGLHGAARSDRASLLLPLSCQNQQTGKRGASFSNLR